MEALSILDFILEIPMANVRSVRSIDGYTPQAQKEERYLPGLMKASDYEPAGDGLLGLTIIWKMSNHTRFFH